MTVLVDVFPEKNITRITVEGELTIDSLRSVVEQYGRPTDDLIVFYSGVDSSSLTTEELQTFAMEIARAVGDRKNLRTCLVIDDVLSFGLARMFETLSEIAGGSIKYHVCRNLEDAEAWLEVAVPPHADR